MIKQQVEIALKQSNRRSAHDMIDLSDIKPDFALVLAKEVKTMMQHFRTLVTEYVAVHNEYVKMKINEEKAKGKKPRLTDEEREQALAAKHTQLTFEAEMERILQEMLRNVPAPVQPILAQKHLKSLLGLKVDSTFKPKLGRTWNKVLFFPAVPAAKKTSTASNGAPVLPSAPQQPVQYKLPGV